MKILLALALAASAALAHAETSPRSRQSFDFNWRFHLGDLQNASATNFDDGSWRRLDVPHDFTIENAFASTNASGTAYLPGGIGWYRKTFAVPGDWTNKLVSIEFDGVSMNSEVWINGHYLGKRPYAYSSFAYELTPYLQFGGTNILAVRADHSQIADSRFYMGSGIYRHVWLVATEKIHVPRHGIYITTPDVSANSATVKIEMTVQNQESAARDIEIITRLIGPDGKVVQEVASEKLINGASDWSFAREAQVARPKLWSPDSPALYRAVTTLRTGGKMVDLLETTFGVRSIRFDAQTGFFLNGRPMKFKGICMHHDGGAVGAAVPEAVLERRLRLAKAIGCNAIRTSHNPMAPEFYDFCDRLGLMVMDEAFDEWTGPKHKWIQGWNSGSPSLHGYSEYFNEWSAADLGEMVGRDRNHPCVMLWSIGNEIDYPNDPFSYPTDGTNYDSKKPSAEILAKTAPRLIQIVHEADPTRPVTAALANLPASNATGLADLLDVVGYNYQIQQYTNDFVKYPNRKIVESETTPALEYYEMAKNPRVEGQFLWVGFDFLGEAPAWPSRGSTAGLFDTCGFLKPRSFLRAALWSEKPVVYLAVRGRFGGFRGGRFGRNLENHWNWENDSRTNLPVEVFSNCKMVELFLNGESLGKKTAAEATNDVFRWDVPFKPGELKAVGSGDGAIVETRLVTAGPPAKLELLPDKTQLLATGQDVSQIELRLVDKDGVLVPTGNALCSVQVSGAGKLLALDNGNQRDMTPLSQPSRKLNRGHAFLIVESLHEPGPITVTVSAEGLPAEHLNLRATLPDANSARTVPGGRLVVSQ
ncbi:MAG TPA: glycoside hydrolase family 2 TIM barrel-domain containing protein [Candidatus Angelobacter sp.]|nr:glycoside hydrolase family 2 TIM barrel-domain containing protein [Candidatus Angelobacter sp.]